MVVVAAMRRRAGDLGAIALLLVLGVLFTLQSWRGPVQWTPDGIYYEAKVLQLRGATEQAAVTRALATPEGTELQHREAAQGEPPRLRDPRWVAYEAQFFRRRWLVPLLALALDPLFGDRCLELISLVGYLGCGVMLLLLLRRRFGILLSTAGATLGLAVSPLTFSASHPLTDTVALAILVGCLFLAARVIDSGLKWLPAWVLAMIALGFTRESSAVVAVSALFLALLLRNRRATWLGLSGVVAAGVPLMVAPVSLSNQMAFALAGYLVPTDTSLLHILADLPRGLQKVIDSDVVSPVRSGQFPLAPLIFLVGSIGILRLGDQNKVVRLLRCSVPAALVFAMLSPAPTELRVVLPLLPAATFGTVLGAEQLLARYRHSRIAAMVAAKPS